MDLYIHSYTEKTCKVKEQLCNGNTTSLIQQHYIYTSVGSITHAKHTKERGLAPSTQGCKHVLEMREQLRILTIYYSVNEIRQVIDHRTAEKHQPPCGCDMCVYTRVYFMHDLQYCFIYTNSP